MVDSLLGDPAVFLADAIDPATGDYLSIQRGVDPIEAQALDALLIRRRSGSAVQADGNGLHEIRRIDERTPLLVRSEVEHAWRRLIEARQIRVDRIDATAQGDTVNVSIAFTNLVSGKAGSMPLPLLTLLPRAA